jgi:RNA polymerase sigma-70 factor (ECF subfamily)
MDHASVFRLNHNVTDSSSLELTNSSILPGGGTVIQDDPLRSKQLVAEARSGSAAAFAELREIYATRVYRKLLIITKNREDAEDALQDTFLRAYKALHAFEERASFCTWVTRIAINSALMILRKRRTRSEVSFDRPSESQEDFPDFELKDAGPTPEHICVHRQRYAHTLRSITKLQPRLRQVIEMQMLDDCSVREIAQALHISEAAAKSRLSRARGRLDPARAARTATAAAVTHGGTAGVSSDEGVDRYLRLMVAILFLWLNQHISLTTKVA